jgi:drug/metabolite transporter (DMT)-like permease
LLTVFPDGRIHFRLTISIQGKDMKWYNHGVNVSFPPSLQSVCLPMIKTSILKLRKPGSEREKRSNILPYLALVAGIMCLSFSALFVRWANAPGPVMAFYRIGLAALIMAPFFGRGLRRGPKMQPYMIVFPAIGGLLTALDHAVFNTSILLTTAANATLLNNTAPLWVALTAWLFLKEKLSRMFWIGLAFSMAGAVIVLGSDFLLHPTLGLGDVLALVSGMFYGGYFLITQRGRKHLNTLSYVWLINLSSAIFLLLISLGLRQPLTGYSTQTYLAFVGAALVSQVFGYLSVGYALGHLPASMVAPTMIGQPVVTALLAIPLLGEGLHLSQIIGGAAVLLGIYVVHLSRQEAAKYAIPEESVPG